MHRRLDVSREAIDKKPKECIEILRCYISDNCKTGRFAPARVMPDRARILPMLPPPLVPRHPPAPFSAPYPKATALVPKAGKVPGTSRRHNNKHGRAVTTVA